MAIDLSLYLVTDSTPAVLGDRDLLAIVEEALKGGVTIVQYRDKTSDTGALIATARKLHAITRAHGVPLLINDRVDVAVAAEVEGVHLGQGDMNILDARKMLPKDAIVGVTVSSVEEAQTAIAQGADYLGIGTVFATQTKKDTKSMIGPIGTKTILESLPLSHPVGTVCIGGINASNAQRVIYQTGSHIRTLDGIAVVSAIISAADPRAAAVELARQVREPPGFATMAKAPHPDEARRLVDQVPRVLQQVVAAHPLVHSMMNQVVSNFVANVLLAIGGSPIMSLHGPEATDLAIHNGGLTINTGTLNDESVPNYLQAAAAYNAHSRPVVLDPVGAAATATRRAAVPLLLAGAYYDLIKGNEGEICGVAGMKGAVQRGVDSGPDNGLGTNGKARIVRDLARRQRNIVLVTGTADYLSDGKRVLEIRNGHEFLGFVTGTGCSVGAIATCFLAAHTHPDHTGAGTDAHDRGHPDKLLAVLTGLLVFEIAAENAAARPDVFGPGSFVPAFLDALYAIRRSASTGADAGRDEWLVGRAKVAEVKVVD